jgi:hypothetical protein
MKTQKSKMELLKNKTAVIMITIFLIVSMGSSLMLMPSANAHSPAWPIQLHAFANANPPIAGVGQAINIGFWMNTPPPTANGPYGDRYGPYYVNVTNPDGTTTTQGPYISDDTGGTHFDYTPTTIGTYKFQMYFNGMTLTGTTNNPANSVGFATTQQQTFIGDYVLPAVSNVAILTVQQEPISLLPNTPLPTTYWQTPVNGMNVLNWNNITGAWLGLGRNANPIGAEMYNFSTNYNPFTTVVNSPHVMWTRPESFGGVVGGAFPGSTSYGLYYPSPQYERRYNPVIINGYLIYTDFPSSSTNPTSILGVDLYTGQVIWTDSTANNGGSDAAHSALSNGRVTQVSFGQVLNFVAPNQYGGIGYFWTTGTPDWITASRAVNSTTPGLHFSGSTYNLFDAKTGAYLLSVVNGTNLEKTVDANGDIIGYYLNSTLGTQRVNYNQQALPATYQLATNTNRTGTATASPMLEEWNSTLAILNNNWFSSQNGWSWRPASYGIVDFQGGVEWAQPVAANYTGLDYGIAGPLAFWAINSNTIILNTGVNWPGIALSFQVGWSIWAGYDSNTGEQLWIRNYTMDPFTSVSLNCEFLAGDGNFITETRETGNFTAYNMRTGNQVWSIAVGAQADTYNTIGAYQGAIAGKDLYMIGFGGDIWSINIDTGAINWYTNTTVLQGPAGTNTPYGVWPIWEQNGIGVADGKIFLEEGHEYSPPTFLGAKTLAVNATDGSLVWAIDGFSVNGLPYMAYGQINMIDGYNNEIEDFGQGPSATTVSAPSVGVTTATPITITGSVMDISAGAKQEEVAANFPNGLPAVSDASMEHFMEAVYMQQPMPNNTTGVPVTISVIDSNGNNRIIGTTTSDTTGQFGLTWTPDISGKYTVTATFAGSGGYYGSKAQTYFTASEAATPAPTNAPPAGLATNADLMTFIVGGVIAIIIVVAIATLLILRKRP